MRVYISVDMEGVAGVVHEDQTNPIDPRYAGEYNRFRRLMTAEANAAIEGALAAGATTILVNDSHWLMRNLLAEELHPAAELLSGGPKARSMVEGIELGFDAAFFVGYHARAGVASAIIDHTYTSRVYEARLNGKPVGELAINAALAGTWDVPVAMVSGDQALAAEAREWLGPSAETVVVKVAVGRFAARSVSPVEACRRIREGATASLGRSHVPLTLSPPVRLEVDFALTQMADMAELVPGSVRTAGRTVEYVHDDYREVFRAWRALYNLASVE
ncbi:MAG: M55 family metallopeptidase [Gemmatimonadales bacterium]